MKLKAIVFITFLASLLSIDIAYAKGVQFNLLKSTPTGSWQVRENVETRKNGKGTGTIVRTSMLGSEMLDGEKHYWVEIEMEMFKISKKGTRKPDGEKVIMKSLVAESILNGDPVNVLGNLRGFGKDVIMQSGDSEPVRMAGMGGMMQGMMSGLEVKYDFQELGSDETTVAAGNFKTKKIQGSGSTQGKVLFKTINLESSNTVWISDKVPFGMVKSEGTNTNNGKQSSFKSELKEFGTSGAVSAITQQPMEMPAMPNLKDLLK